MLIIACVKQGPKYPASSVNILRDMVARNLSDTVEGRFVCFTDDPEGLDDGIETIPLPSDVHGWWAKLYLFKRGHFDDGDRIVYFDLDTVIVSALDDLVNYTGPLAVVADFYRSFGGRSAVQSCVMAWPANTETRIWDDWLAARRPLIPGGDQEWIEKCVPGVAFLQSIFPFQIVSYKLHCSGRLPPHGARVVNFHGEPKPEDAPEDWVHHIWRKGGGTLADIELTFNLPAQEIHEHIRENSKRDLQWLKSGKEKDGAAIIVGGAPSVRSFLPEIEARRRSGGETFALNGSGHLMRRSGVSVDHQVLLDARPDNKDFICAARHFLVASQCDPSVFDELAYRSDKTTLWHAHIDGIERFLPDNAPEHCLIAAGSTVGMASLVIAYAMGFRIIHVYGMDSSFQEAGKHHAYEQKLNDEDTVIEAHAAGRTFLTTPWMVSQVREFQIVAAQLIEKGCEIHIHGDGLLPHVARTLVEIEADTERSMKRVDGYWFPVSDTDGLDLRLGERESFARIISNAKGRGVAVQAGGNVGIFADMLGKEFSRVVTFEPDHENFDCLKRNVRAANVSAMRAALGSEPGRVGLTRTISNGGAHFVSAGDEIPMMRIDDLALDQCDLIALDIEGYELEALKGAERTISRHLPVIAIEDKGLSERYGTPEGGAVEWLSRFGYSVVDRSGRDVILGVEP